jgi:hypothetical protein
VLYAPPTPPPPSPSLIAQVKADMRQDQTGRYHIRVLVIVEEPLDGGPPITAYKIWSSDRTRRRGLL